MSDETVTIEAETPTKKKAARKAAEPKTGKVRYFAFAKPHTNYSIPDSYAGSIKSVNVNQWGVVVAFDAADDNDAVMLEVLDNASMQYGGRRGVNPSIKEVAGDLSDGEKRMIGSGISFNAQAYTTAFEGLKRI